MKALTTDDIQRYLKSDNEFIGVYPINKVNGINTPKLKNVAFIANLQADNLPGNHWVAVRRCSSGYAKYFDSFGRIPPREIQHWLVNNSNCWTHNKLIMQKLDDKTACGYLCIAFVKHLI